MKGIEKRCYLAYNVNMFGNKNREPGLYRVGVPETGLPVKGYLVEMGEGEAPLAVAGSEGTVNAELARYIKEGRRITVISGNGNGSNGNGHKSG